MLAFRLVNVFGVPGQRLSGNPLCVFEDGRGLADAQMQALAQQFNLSETTFVLSPEAAAATARVRIFTPSFEMPFAGHPTLGTARVVDELRRTKGSVTLELPAGLVEVRADGDLWTLRTARPSRTREVDAQPGAYAAMLGLPAEAVPASPLWVDAGVEQLVVPLADAASVARARPDPTALAKLGLSASRQESMAYVWAEAGAGRIKARFFFLDRGAVIEDPATGSACANLGGFLLARGRRGPLRLEVSQGEEIGRPSRLGLTVDEAGAIFVSGQVVEVGRGTIDL